jgi:hypothetical protein
MRNLAWYRLLGTVMILALALWSFAPAAEGPDKTKQGAASLDKGAGSPRWAVMTINNIWSWHRSDGEGNHSPTGVDGVFYPKFTGHCVYEDNVVFGAELYTGGFPTSGGTAVTNQFVRINGGTYLSNHGMDEGWVIGSGASAVPVDKNDPAARIYRIRRDYLAMTSAEVNEDARIYYEKDPVTAAEEQAILDQYALDWVEWPVQYGAPYIDRNGNGVYDPPPAFAEGVFTVDSLIAGGYDEPGVAGADPNTPADQVIYTVYNGLRDSRVRNFEGAGPMGLEVQKTVFAYKRTDALGNVYFVRYRLINKGGVDIGGGTLGSFYLNNMYLCQWSDIDLGNAGDDLVGSDSLLSLGYAYNGNASDNNYANFNLPPPASGYDFLGGALVDAPGDSGVYNFQRVYDKTNHGMSSFAYFSAGSPYSDPPFNDYDQGAGRWWKMLRGFAPTGSITTADEAYYHPPGQPITKFPFSGDPVAGTGFNDGLGTTYSFAPGDRRILLNTGPFQMAPDDSVDIYVGFVVGIGGDRLSSVAVMKAYDKAVQETFDLVFQVAKPPKNPLVRVSELDGEVLLDWSWDLGTIGDTEERVVMPGQYEFEGYNLYQFPTSGSTLADAVRIGTFDLVNGLKTVTDEVFDPVIGQFVLKPVQFGSDAGVARFVSLKKDYVNDVDKLYNGTPYYYAVTAYSVAKLPGYTAALESAPSIVTARPKVPFGKSLTSLTGDTLVVNRTAGASDGTVVPLVADPLAITGNDYDVTFNADGTWNLVNATTSTTVLANMENQSGDDNYPVTDGIVVKVLGPPNDFLSFQVVSNGAGALDPPEIGCFAFNSNGFPFLNGADRPTSAQQTDGSTWGIHTGYTSANDGTFDYFKVRTTQSGARWPLIIPYDFEIRFTAAGGVGYEPNAFVTGAGTGGTIISVPFELWNIGIGTPNDPSDDYRLFPYLIDSEADGLFNLAPIDHPVSGGDNDPETDWFYWVLPADQSPGQAGYNAIVTDVQANGGTTHEYLSAAVTAETDVLRRFVIVNWNGGSVSDPTFPANMDSQMPESGTTFRILTTKPNSTADVFRIPTANYAPSAGADLAKASANKVGVFPNPYYTQNALESNRFEKFVTFNNLPPKATIRVFNLAGHLVRTLEKDNTSQFFQWDLTNERNFPVSSGIYICYVDMPELGVTKILKLAVIQEQEILDFY